MIIATYALPDGTVFGLSDESLAFTEEFEDRYAVVFTVKTDGKRSSCYYTNCTLCPFSKNTLELLEEQRDKDINCQEHITSRNPHYLKFFGISPENNPEYFI